MFRVTVPLNTFSYPFLQKKLPALFHYIFFRSFYIFGYNNVFKCILILIHYSVKTIFFIDDKGQHYVLGALFFIVKVSKHISRAKVASQKSETLKKRHIIRHHQRSLSSRNIAKMAGHAR